jgi:hypothetical protein
MWLLGDSEHSEHSESSESSESSEEEPRGEQDLVLKLPLSHPWVLLLGWMWVHGWFLATQRDFTLYDYAHLAVSLYNGIPYGLLCIMTLYIGVVVPAVFALSRKDRYFRHLCLLSSRNPFVRVGPCLYSVVCVASIGGSFIYPLPGAILSLSFLSNVPAMHGCILSKMYAEELGEWEAEGAEDAVIEN